MKARLQSKLPGTFEALAALLPLRPIRSERDLDRAQAIADRLAVLARRTRDQEDYLQTLSLLIEAYEDMHHAIDAGNLEPIDILKSILADHGMSASDLGRILGNRALGAAVLRGDRQLSKAHIATLCSHFAVGPELFIKAAVPTRKAS